MFDMVTRCVSWMRLSRCYIYLPENLYLIYLFQVIKQQMHINFLSFATGKTKSHKRNVRQQKMKKKKKQHDEIHF